ncbi:hypothetical protein H5410_046431 [Solanum commersonii]|uniref:DUF4283 domain-containing protein n=1 Tax=Solanum commersonii TaxID=4109 RepID=A0A9J5XEB2_SOLCO|nr:hypothetical protein H5410_046431 [Solanum commersonii]
MDTTVELDVGEPWPELMVNHLYNATPRQGITSKESTPDVILNSGTKEKGGKAKENQGRRVWVGIFYATKLAAKGMDLSYIPRVIKEGEVVVQLTEEDVEEENGVFLHNDGYFVVRFSGSDEKEEVLFKGPYILFNRSVIIKSWAPNFNFKEEVLHTIQLWVMLPSLPLNYWTATTLNKIGSGLGKPVCTNAWTSNMERISYVRLLVEIDVTQQMKEKIIRLRDENLPVEKPRGKKGERGKEKVQEEQQWSNPIGKSARRVAQHNMQEVGTSNGFEILEYYDKMGMNEAE